MRCYDLQWENSTYHFCQYKNLIKCQATAVWIYLPEMFSKVEITVSLAVLG